MSKLINFILGLALGFTMLSVSGLVLAKNKSVGEKTVCVKIVQVKPVVLQVGYVRNGLCVVDK